MGKAPELIITKKHLRLCRRMSRTNNGLLLLIMIFALEMAGSALDNPILKHYMSDLDKVGGRNRILDMERCLKCKVRPDLYIPGAGCGD